jgi:hypothetical protein
MYHEKYIGLLQGKGKVVPLLKHHSKKTHGIVEVKLDKTVPTTKWIEASLGCMANRKIPNPARDQ